VKADPVLLHQAIAAEYRGTRASPVLKSRNDIELMTSRVGSAQSNLIFSRFFVLKLGREPSIDRCGLHLEYHCCCASRLRHQDDSSSNARFQKDDRVWRRQLQVLQHI
jgi:hypothetical protein